MAEENIIRNTAMKKEVTALSGITIRILLSLVSRLLASYAAEKENNYR
jgi:hypothetical protein